MFYRKSLRSFVFLVIVFSVIGAHDFASRANAAKVKHKRSPVFAAAYQTEYQFDPRMQAYLQGIVNNWQLGITHRNPAILSMFEMQNKPNHGGLLPWSGEFAGKYLTGAVEILRLTGDESLKAYLRGFVKRLVGLQENNGYLGPWTKEHQLKNTKPGEGSDRYTWDAWNHYHLMIGLIQWYELTGDEEALTAVEKIGTLVCETFYDKPNALLDLDYVGWTRGSQEYNLTLAHSLMKLYEIVGDDRYLAMSRQMTGESVVADVIEVMHFNALRGAQDISGKWSTYHTGTEGTRTPNTIDIKFQKRPGSPELNCCSVNAARGFGLVSEWAIMKDEKGLILNWYGQSEFKTNFETTEVQIEQRTSYPGDGKIRITVTPSKSIHFDLRLRIPFWSKNTIVKVNSEDVESPQAGRYLSLNRQWNHGDEIELLLDMGVAYWPGEKGRKEYASFYYGPLLLAFRPEVQGEIETIGEMHACGPLVRSRTPGAALKFTSGGAFKLYCNTCSDAGRISVTIDGQLREQIDLYDPGRDVPYYDVSHRVVFDDLEPGRHEVVVTVLERNETSKGNRVRLGVRNYDLPVFDLTTFSWTPVETKDANALVTIQCTDKNGDTVKLVDFDSAGWNDRFYASWLPVVNENKSTFSKDNPLRLIRAARVDVNHAEAH